MLGLFVGVDAIRGRKPGGLQAIADFVEEAVPPAERETTTQALLRLLYDGARSGPRGAPAGPPPPGLTRMSGCRATSCAGPSRRLTDGAALRDRAARRAMSCGASRVDRVAPSIRT